MSDHPLRVKRISLFFSLWFWRFWRFVLWLLVPSVLPHTLACRSCHSCHSSTKPRFHNTHIYVTSSNWLGCFIRTSVKVQMNARHLFQLIFPRNYLTPPVSSSHFFFYVGKFRLDLISFNLYNHCNTSAPAEVQSYRWPKDRLHASRRFRSRFERH